MNEEWLVRGWQKCLRWITEKPTATDKEKNEDLDRPTPVWPLEQGGENYTVCLEDLKGDQAQRIEAKGKV